jgi:hypothetical protein
VPETQPSPPAAAQYTIIPEIKVNIPGQPGLTATMTNVYSSYLINTGGYTSYYLDTQSGTITFDQDVTLSLVLWASELTYEDSSFRAGERIKIETGLHTGFRLGQGSTAGYFSPIRNDTIFANLSQYGVLTPLTNIAVDNNQAPAAPEGTPPAAEIITVKLNGTPLTFDVLPQLINGRTMVPLRAVFEAMGASIDWNGDIQTVTALKDNKVVVLTINDPAPTIDGTVVLLDQPGIIVDGRTLVPLRFVAEAFGGTVEWDSATQTASIYMTM